MIRHVAVKAGALLMTVALVASGCAGASQSAQPTGQIATTQPSSSNPTPSPDASASVGPSSGPLTVAFVTPVPKPSWGAKPFKVRAKASDGMTVTYHADGACTVVADTGEVTVTSLGTCTITADVADADPPVSAAQTFTVAKAKPVIKFDNSTTRFARPFKYRLPVTVTPDIPLKLAVDLDDPRGTNDDFCAIDDGALVFDPTPTADNFPQIPAKCVVRVTATGTKNYEAPKAVARVITIGLAAFAVNAAEVVNLDYSDSGGNAEITVVESSGDAFGVDIQGNGDNDVNGDNFLCETVSTAPDPAPAGTTRYTVTVKIQEPPNGEPYDCEMTAQAVPPDYQGGKFKDDFTIHVVP